MLSFPYAEGTLPQKLGRRCNHPHGVASAEAKKKKYPQKNVWQRLSQSSPLPAWLQGPVLHCARFCDWSLAWQECGEGSGTVSLVLAVQLPCLSGCFPASFSSPSLTPCPRRGHHTPAGLGEVRTSFCSVPIQGTEGECTLNTQ